LTTPDQGAAKPSGEGNKENSSSSVGGEPGISANADGQGSSSTGTGVGQQGPIGAGNQESSSTLGSVDNGSTNTSNGHDTSTATNAQENLTTPGEVQGNSTSSGMFTSPEQGQGSSTAPINGQGSSTDTGGQENSNTSNSQSSSGVPTAPCGEQATKQPSAVNITCPEAGFFSHPINCEKFYRCVDWDGKGEKFSVYYFDCPEGTIFDPSLSVCNYPESVYPARNCAPRSNASSEKPPQQTTEGTKHPVSTASETVTETTDVQAPDHGLSSTEGRPTTETATGPPETTLTSQEIPNTTTVTDGLTGTTHEETTGTSGAGSTVTDATIITTNQVSTDAEITVTEAATTTNEGGSTDLTTATPRPDEESSNPPQTSNMETTNPTEGTSSTSESTSGTESTGTGIVGTTATPETGSLTEIPGETGVMTTEGTATPGGSEGQCPVVGTLDQDQIVVVCPTGFRRHPKYCDLFYQCTVSGHEMNILVLACVNGTVFDEEKIQCLPPEKARPCQGRMAGGRLNRNVDESSESLPVSMCNCRISMER
jgi:hypothetical protein